MENGHTLHFWDVLFACRPNVVVRGGACSLVCGDEAGGVSPSRFVVGETCTFAREQVERVDIVFENQSVCPLSRSHQIGQAPVAFE